MARVTSIVVAFILGAAIWEVGHPYIPGIGATLDHGAEETCHTH